MRHTVFVCLTAVLGSVSPAMGQATESFRLMENFGKDAQYHVSCQVEITGTLPVPATNNQASGKTLQVIGKSSLKYDERILRMTQDQRVDRTLRYYQLMDFQRKVGNEEQQNQLRPEARRMVILRRNQYEVPFCPTTPLTWGEVELVRTDVFVPALRGLFPTQSVRIGDRWPADNVAIQELTDLETIERADIVCAFEKITTFNGRRNAHVRFEGKVQGVGEDGKALHELRGSYYVDIDANFLNYVYVKGTHHLLDKNGLTTGKIEGSFVLTRTQAPHNQELTDIAIRGLVLEPNPDNTMLLFDQPKLGVQMHYSRNWRVAGSNEKQIGIDENRGSGLLITLTPGVATPTGAQFYQESLHWLSKEKGRLLRDEKPRTVQPGLETFTLEVELAKQKVILQYYVARQGYNGATIAVRTTPGEASTIQRDVDRMVRTLRLSTPK